MIRLDEFKRLATETGLHLWKSEVDTEWYISYPLPMFEGDTLLQSALMSIVPEYDIFYIYDSLQLQTDTVNKNLKYYTLLATDSFQENHNNKTYEDLKKHLLKMKKKLLNKQIKLNFKKMEGDFK